MEIKAPAQEGILSNNTLDLMAQLTEENQSLWRIKTTTKKTKQTTEEVMDFWNYLEKDKQDHINKLTELLEKRVKLGVLNPFLFPVFFLKLNGGWFTSLLDEFPTTAFSAS